MLLNTLILPLELALNNYLRLDAEIHKQLSPLTGKLLHVEVNDFPLNIYVHVQQDKLALLTTTSANITTHIRGNLFDLGEMAWKSRNKQAHFSKKLHVQGDLDFLQALRDIFLKLEVDWEEQFAKIVGDVAAYNISKAMKNFGNWAQNSLATFNQDLSEYLQEETRLLLTRVELDDFMRDVDMLRDDVERLEAKINLIRTNELRHLAA